MISAFVIVVQLYVDRQGLYRDSTGQLKACGNLLQKTTLRRMVFSTT
jgi:hypothetical protein